MDITDILSVGLTAEDFDLLVKGLDAIPGKETAELMNAELMGIMLAPTAIHSQQRSDKILKKLEDLKRTQEAKSEDFIVLKSKLILLKRLLATNAAVGATNEIIGGGKPQIIDNYQTGKKITNLTKITKIKFGDNMLVS